MVPVAPQELPHRHPGSLAGQVPQRVVHHGPIDVGGRIAQALHVHQALPNDFTMVRILTH